MPIYEYECSAASCGVRTEATRPIAERADAPACPCCGQRTELALSAPMVLFRGAGWSAPTTQQKLRTRSAEHAARGHALPLKARRPDRAIGPLAPVPMLGTSLERKP
jgi:putative FmdB family regulatory protein